VTEEGIETLGAHNVRRNVPADTGVPIYPLDLKPFPFEQTFFIGDDFGQALEWRARLQQKLGHVVLPWTKGILVGSRN